MSYVSYAEVVGRYPILEKWAETEMAVTSDLIYYAEMRLNSLMAPAFSVPFSGSHPTVKDLTIDLAYHRAMLTHDAEGAEAFEKAVLGRIDRIKDGKEYIYTESYTVIKPEAQGDEAAIWSNTKDYHPVHTMLGAEHEDTIISSERLEDLEDVRD
jgi:hypothetical protein